MVKLYSENRARELSQSMDKDDIFEVGKDIIILEDELEQSIAYYKLGGHSEGEAQKMAVTHVEERNALYAEAMKQGYATTDREVYDYLDELKATLETAANKEDYFSVLKGYGSEEEYWDAEFKVYQMDLPTQNYVSKMTKDFYKSLDTNSSEDPQDAFSAYFKIVKQELCEKQEFTAP